MNRRLRFQKEEKRPVIEDESLQLKIPEHGVPSLNVKQLYRNYREHIAIPDISAYQALEEEISSLQSVAKQLQSAYKEIISSNK